MKTPSITEIAPDLFRLSIYVPDFDMQFNHFLVRDEEPLRFHAGLKPQTLAAMHGSSYSGHGDRLLTDLAGLIKENFDQAEPSAAPTGG